MFAPLPENEEIKLYVHAVLERWRRFERCRKRRGADRQSPDDYGRVKDKITTGPESSQTELMSTSSAAPRERGAMPPGRQVNP